MADLQNVRRALDHRERVSLLLRIHGLQTQPAKLRRPISAELLGDPPTGDVTGLSRWAVVTQASVRARPGEALERAQDIAKASGKDYAAVVLDRPGSRAADNYVVMAASDWARVVAELENVGGASYRESVPPTPSGSAERP